MIGYNRADAFRQKCIDEHEELETNDINKLGREFIEISSKTTKTRTARDSDRKQEIIRLLMNRVRRVELNNTNLLLE